MICVDRRIVCPRPHCGFLHEQKFLELQPGTDGGYGQGAGSWKRYMRKRATVCKTAGLNDVAMPGFIARRYHGVCL